MTKGMNRKGFVGGLGGLLAMCAVAAECRAETALELGIPADGRADAVAPLHAAFARGVR